MSVVRIKDLEGSGAILIGNYDFVHLSEQRRSIFLLLMGNALVTKWMIIEALWPDPDKQPLGTTSIIGVHLNYLRNGLKKLDADFYIQTHGNRGWSLERRPLIEFKRFQEPSTVTSSG